MSAAVLSRRSAFAGVAAALCLPAAARARAARPLKFEEPADARLMALAVDIDTTLDGAAYAMEPVEDHEDHNARLDRAEAAIIRMSKIPAVGGLGLYAKAKAWLDSDSYDVQGGSTLAESLAHDIERMHAVGGLL